MFYCCLMNAVNKCNYSVKYLITANPSVLIQYVHYNVKQG